MSEQVVIILQGGLGNQLFQYAAGLALAGSLGGELCLTPPEDNHHSAKDYRAFMPRGRALVATPSPSQLDVDHVATEAFAAWNPEDFRGVQRLRIRGYFQHLPTIESQIPLVRDDIFQHLTIQRTQVKQKYRIVSPRQTAFMHVRRGDYKNFKPDIFWLQGPEYYEPAQGELQARTGRRRLLILSDDPDWCRQQPWCTGEVIDEPDEIAGLLLMSLCEGGAIIGNSTFAWWGAMLGSGFSGAPVVYPRRWFKRERPALFPENWIAAGPEPHAG